MPSPPLNRLVVGLFRNMTHTVPLFATDRKVILPSSALLMKRPQEPRVIPVDFQNRILKSINEVPPRADSLWGVH